MTLYGFMKWNPPKWQRSFKWIKVLPAQQEQIPFLAFCSVRYRLVPNFSNEAAPLRKRLLKDYAILVFFSTVAL